MCTEIILKFLTEIVLLKASVDLTHSLTKFTKYAATAVAVVNEFDFWWHRKWLPIPKHVVPPIDLLSSSLRPNPSHTNGSHIGS